MKTISLRLPEDELKTATQFASALRVSRTGYIRKAIEQMNAETQSRFRAERLARASRKVRKESMRVNAEFAAIEGAPDV